MQKEIIIKLKKDIEYYKNINSLFAHLQNKEFNNYINNIINDLNKLVRGLENEKNNK